MGNARLRVGHNMLFCDAFSFWWSLRTCLHSCVVILSVRLYTGTRSVTSSTAAVSSLDYFS